MVSGRGHLGWQEGPGCWCGDFEMFNQYLRIESGLKDLEASMDADMQPQEHVSEAMCPFCQGEGKQALWGTENSFYKFLRNAGFY